MKLSMIKNAGVIGVSDDGLSVGFRLITSTGDHDLAIQVSNLHKLISALLRLAAEAHLSRALTHTPPQQLTLTPVQALGYSLTPEPGSGQHLLAVDLGSTQVVFRLPAAGHKGPVS